MLGLQKITEWTILVYTDGTICARAMDAITNEKVDLRPPLVYSGTHNDPILSPTSCYQSSYGLRHKRTFHLLLHRILIEIRPRTLATALNFCLDLLLALSVVVTYFLGRTLVRDALLDQVLKLLSACRWEPFDCPCTE